MKTQKKKGRGISNVLERRIIEIHTEAYYNAIKRINEEKNRVNTDEQTPIENNQYKKDNVLFFLNIFLLPWKINKKFKINKRIYDSVLVLFIALIMIIIGTLIWGTGLVVIVYSIIQIIKAGMILESLFLTLVGVLISLFGSLFIISATEFSKETNSNIIYAYSGSVLALVGCILAVITYFKT